MPDSNFQSKIIQKILRFWFGDIRDGFTVEARDSFWFEPDTETDELIRRRFGELVELASEDRLDDWGETPGGRLALIILLDQFTRNIFRGTKEAFALDDKARELCKEGLELGQDKELAFIERSFYYLPLEHSEDIADQELCVKLLEDMLREVPPDKQDKVRDAIQWAVVHKDIIEHFGRFPHRNYVLQRTSAPEEEKYLRAAQTSFGQ